MRPVSELRLDRPPAAVLTDLDGTLTTRGRLDEAAARGLYRLERARVTVAIVSGRPAGWADCLARLLPVAGVVAENGGVVCLRGANGLERRFAESEDERRRDRERLDALGRDILERFPAARLASDQPFRFTDLAIDLSEDVRPMGRAFEDEVLSICRAAGARARVSNVHVNAWFGDHDKASGTRRLLGWLFDGAVPGTVVYVGDSPNDEPMFEAYPLSVGVGGVRRFADRMQTLPAFVTASDGGRGFAEVVDALLGAP